MRRYLFLATLLCFVLTFDVVKVAADASYPLNPNGSRTAPFVTADLAGTWYLSVISDRTTGNDPGWTSLTLNVNDSGQVTSGSGVDSSGSPVTITGGSLTINSFSGVISGTLTNPSTTVTIVHGKLDGNKTFFEAVVSDSDNYRSLVVGIKAGGSFDSTDADGTWYVHVYSDNTSENFPNWTWLTLDVSGGVVTGGSGQDASGLLLTVIGDSFSVNPDDGTGSGTISVSTGPESPAVTVTISHMKLDSGKKFLAAVGSDTTGSRSLIVASKAGGNFATADLEGTWYLSGLSDEFTGNDPGWFWVRFNVDASGQITGGSIVNSYGDNTGITGGSLTIDGAGVFSGSVTASDDSGTFIIHGKLDAGKTALAAVGLSYYGRWLAVGSSGPLAPTDSDILWRSSTTGEVYAWYMNGSTHSGGASLGYVADQTWQIVGVGDFDGDGSPDILWRSGTTGEVYVWFMPGGAHSGGASLGSVADQTWQIVGVGSFGM